jgi:hypothetical protein
MPKALKILLKLLILGGNLALLILICISRDDIQTCARNIYGLLVALYIFNILSVFLFSSYFLTLHDRVIWDWERVTNSLITGFIGMVGLSYMIQIEQDTPACFDGTIHPKWLAWVGVGYGLTQGVPQAVGTNIGVLHTLLFFIIPDVVTGKIKQKKLVDFEEDDDKAKERDDNVLTQIKAELENKDFDKHDIKGWSEFVRYERVNEDTPIDEGFTQEDKYTKGPQKTKEKYMLMKSTVKFPTNYHAKDTIRLLKILRKTDNHTLSAPMISAWLNFYYSDHVKKPNFFRVYFIVFNFLYTIYLLLDDGDLIYLNIFFFGHSSYTFVNNSYTLLVDPSSLWREPEYIFSYLSGIGVAIICIISWLEIDRTSQIYTLTAALLMIVLWIKILYSMSARESLRKFMILLEKAMIGLGPFLTVLILNIVGFSLAFHIWNRNNINESTSNFNGYGFSFYQTYSLTLGGFDLSNDPPFDVTFILIVLGAFILNIVLLNILVSILGKIQDEVEQDAEGASNRIKIGILMDGHRQIIGEKSTDDENRIEFLYWYMEKAPKDLEEEVHDLKGDVKVMKEQMAELNTNMKEILQIIRRATF